MEIAKPIKKIIIALVMIVIFFLTITITFVLLKNKTRSQREKFSPIPTTQVLSPTNTPTPKIKKIGAISLSATKQAVSLTKGEKITVLAKLNSEGRDVVGFDIILKFDQKSLTLDRVKSLLPSFSLFKRAVSTGEVITGAKKVSQKRKIILNNDPLVRLVFTPKREGQYNIGISAANGIDKTQFVNSQTQIIYPKTTNLSIYVKQ